MLREIERIFKTVTIYLTILLWSIIFQTLLANMLRKPLTFHSPYIVEKLYSKYKARHNILG
jgi:hypothetical protein